MPQPVITPEQILRAREVVGEIYMDEKIEKYILDIVFATRSPKDYQLANLARPHQLRRITPGEHQPRPRSEGLRWVSDLFPHLLNASTRSRSSSR